MSAAGGNGAAATGVVVGDVSTDRTEHVVKWRRVGHDKWERQDPAG